VIEAIGSKICSWSSNCFGHKILFLECKFDVHGFVAFARPRWTKFDKHFAQDDIAPSSL
jgi:hypothetical protein